MNPILQKKKFVFARFLIRAAGSALFYWLFLIPASGAETTLKKFQVESKGNFVVISWKTASESNTRGFYLLSSTDNKNYSVLGTFIPCLKCNEEGEANYSMTHFQAKPGRTYSYILKCIGASGESVLANPVLFTFHPIHKTQSLKSSVKYSPASAANPAPSPASDGSLQNPLTNNGDPASPALLANTGKPDGRQALKASHNFPTDTPENDPVANTLLQKKPDHSLAGMANYLQHILLKNKSLFLLLGFLLIAVCWAGIRLVAHPHQ